MADSVFVQTAFRKINTMSRSVEARSMPSMRAAMRSTLGMEMTQNQSVVRRPVCSDWRWSKHQTERANDGNSKWRFNEDSLVHKMIFHSGCPSKQMNEIPKNNCLNCTGAMFHLSSNISNRSKVSGERGMNPLPWGRYWSRQQYLMWFFKLTAYHQPRRGQEPEAGKIEFILGSHERAERSWDLDNQWLNAPWLQTDCLLDIVGEEEEISECGPHKILYFASLRLLFISGSAADTCWSADLLQGRLFTSFLVFHPNQHPLLVMTTNWHQTQTSISRRSYGAYDAQPWADPSFGRYTSFPAELPRS